MCHEIEEEEKKNDRKFPVAILGEMSSERRFVGKFSVFEREHKIVLKKLLDVLRIRNHSIQRQIFIKM